MEYFNYFFIRQNTASGEYNEKIIINFAIFISIFNEYTK